MAAWPGTLPNQFVGTKYKRRAGARVRTEMDTGIPKMRRRFTAAIKEITTPIVLTGAQLVIFETFYQDTLLEGTIPFTWEDPISDATVDFRFVGEPEFTLVAGNATPDDRIWSGRIKLEIVP